MCPTSSILAHKARLINTTLSNNHRMICICPSLVGAFGTAHWHRLLTPIFRFLRLANCPITAITDPAIANNNAFSYHGLEVPSGHNPP